jgi:uncharacterized protein YdeI (YjbR/CyaY-like superfamily)
MPADIREALVSLDLRAAYGARPAYQRNDYLAWIARAKLPATREKRIRQMIRELRGGSLYMNMAWRPRSARASAKR